jgi:Na+-driven multidrug efflux pump
LYGLSTGLEPLISQAYGAKRYHMMGRILNRGIVILLVTCVPITAVWVDAERLLIFMKQDPEIAREAGRYLRWMIPDLVALAGAQPVRVYLRSQVKYFSRTFLFFYVLSIEEQRTQVFLYVHDMGSVGWDSACAGVSAVTCEAFSKDVSVFFVLLRIEHSEKIYWVSNYQNRSHWLGLSPCGCICQHRRRNS